MIKVLKGSILVAGSEENIAKLERALEHLGRAAVTVYPDGSMWCAFPVCEALPTTLRAPEDDEFIVYQKHTD